MALSDSNTFALFRNTCSRSPCLTSMTATVDWALLEKPGTVNHFEPLR